MARAKQQLLEYWSWQKREIIATHQEMQSRLRLRVVKRGVEGIDLSAAIVSLVLLAQ